MKISEVRKVLLLHAAESADEEETWISSSEKSRASSQAGAPLPKIAGERKREEFLSTRADLLLDGLSSKSTTIGKSLGRSSSGQRFGLFMLGIILVAAIIGYLTNELGPEKRINILAFPLIGLLAWNFLVYLHELWLITRPSARLFQSGPVHWLSGFFLKSKEHGEEDSEGEEKEMLRAVQAFENRWHKLTLPLWGIRIKILLHFTAITLAVAAIAGMYVQGIANEYRAGWESTFFSDGAQLRPFLQTILGPAASIAGSEIPDVPALNAMKWGPGSDETNQGANAAQWIHWYAITIGLFILLPRLLFVFAWQLRKSNLSRSLPYQAVAPRYFEHLLSVSTGSSMELAITPYAHDPSESTRATVQRVFEDLYERPITLSWKSMIEFGDEESAKPDPGGGSDGTPLLFNFAATPEKETHLETFRSFTSDEENSPLVLLDADSFDQKNKAFPDAEQRREKRLHAWEALLREENCQLIVVPESPVST